MKLLNPQFITDNAGKKLSVVLSIKEYEQILEELEELEDVRLYDKVKTLNEDSIPLEEYRKQRNLKKDA